MKDPKHILITGGSSGIGEALALHYAAPGIHLVLSGQSSERLEAVADSCRAQGAEVATSLVSVTDKASMEAWINSLDDARPLDLVIANAGVGYGPSDCNGLADIAEKTFAVNVDGLFHTIHPALARMKERGVGQVAVMASIAGIVGLASSPAYSASKNAARAYGEALRGAYRVHGVEVNVICPGYVVSRLTDRNNFKMPFLMTAERAANIIARGLRRNKGRIAFPWQTYYLIRMVSLLPISWLTTLSSKAKGKD